MGFLNYDMKHPFLFFISLLFILSSCRSKSGENHIITTATLKGPSAMAMIKMIDGRPSPDNSWSTQFIIRNEPDLVMAMIMEGSVDFAVLPSTMGALLYNKTHEYILAAVPVWGTLYLFGTDTTIRTWKDLKGKKVSLMARGMTPDIMFRYLAERNGLDPGKDMTLDYSFPTHIELANAIAAGISDLGVISEPMVSMVMKKNPAVHPIIDFNHEWIKLFGDSIPFAQTALLVKKRFAAKNPTMVAWYLSELKESIKWVNTFPDSAAKLIVKYGILPDTGMAAASVSRCNLHYSEAWNDRKGIEEYFKVFYTFNPLILGGSMPDEKFYYKEQTY